MIALFLPDLSVSPYIRAMKNPTASLMLNKVGVLARRRFKIVTREQIFFFIVFWPKLECWQMRVLIRARTTPIYFLFLLTTAPCHTFHI